MKKKISIIVAMSLLTTTACKKNTDSVAPQPNGTLPLIASIKQTMFSNQVYDLKKEFVYDSVNRLKEVKHSGANTSNVTEKYAYSGSSVQYRHYISGAETLSAAINYTLNGEGKATILVAPYFNASNVNEYNSAGYITRVNYLSNNKGTGFQLYHYRAGNILDSISGFGAEGDKKYVHVFTYEAGKKNTISDENRGLQMLGKVHEAPVKKRTMFSYDIISREGERLKYFELDYNYDYDNNGRIKKHTVVQTQYSYPSGSSQSYIKEVMEYTYK